MHQQDFDIYYSGQRIVCENFDPSSDPSYALPVGTWCLHNPFNGSPLYGEEIKPGALALLNGGCKGCGAIGFPLVDNSTAQGILVVDWFPNVYGCGSTLICPPTYAADNPNNPHNSPAQASA